MRDLEFRAWDREYKVMCKVDVIAFGLGAHLIGLPVEEELQYQDGYRGDYTILPKGERFRTCNQIELMQYTGLKDSNGQEVYEGDIANYWGKVVTIIYDEESAGFAMRGLEKWDCHFLRPNPKDYEVIGNIYSNPDLLT